MQKIKIFTDSTSDLPKELIEENNISIIPLYVIFNDKAYKDGIDLTQKDLYKKVEELNLIPKTAAPSPKDFVQAFKPYIDEGYDILFIGLSSKISSTIQNANIAKMEFPKGRIEIVDSLNLSSAVGLLALKACEYRDRGMGLGEIAENIRQLVPKVETNFVIDTLEYLHLGGRLSSIQSLVGTALKIKPIIKMVDGELTVAHKARGKIDKVANIMLKKALKEGKNIDPTSLFVTHSSGKEAAHYLKDKILANLNIDTIHIGNAGCVISSHCGPGTVGIIYMKK